MYYEQEDGDLMLAGCQELQESEAAEVYVKRFKNQEVFVQQPYDFRCAAGTVKTPESQRLASPAGRDSLQEEDEEIETGEKKEGSKGSWSMSGDFTYRHHEEHGTKLHDPDDGTFPIPLKYVDVLRRTRDFYTAAENVINDMWTERKSVKLSEVWTGTTRFQIITYKTSTRKKIQRDRLTKIQ